MTRWTLALILGLASAAAGCVGACDLLSDYSSKNLGNGYCLELELETKIYRLRDCSNPMDRSGGVFDGALERIGWNSRVVVGWRTSDEGVPGWMSLDLSSKKVSGPVSEAEMLRLIANDDRFRGLVLQKASDVLR